jgi:hypothetical protein
VYTISHALPGHLGFVLGRELADAVLRVAGVKA